MTRNVFSAEQNVTILKEYVDKHLSVAEICEKYRIHPNQFYTWKKELFEGALDTFRTAKRGFIIRSRTEKSNAFFRPAHRRRSENNAT